VGVYFNQEEDTIMAWTKPIIREIECGMEINMYGPDGDGEDAGGVLF
jgi:coenzyme PQQ precursor peptide PqqA